MLLSPHFRVDAQQDSTFSFEATDTVATAGFTLDSEQEKLDTLFMSLDMNEVETGVLYDKVLPIADMLYFEDTVITKPSSNPLHFHQVYFEYYSGSLLKDSVTHPDSLIAILENEYNGLTHPIVVMKAEISSIKDNAIEDNLLYFDGRQLHRTEARENPFEIRKIGVASIGARDLFFSEGEHNLVLDPRFSVGNDQSAPIPKQSRRMLSLFVVIR